MASCDINPSSPSIPASIIACWEERATHCTGIWSICWHQEKGERMSGSLGPIITKGSSNDHDLLLTKRNNLSTAILHSAHNGRPAITPSKWRLEHLCTVFKPSFRFKSSLSMYYSRIQRAMCLWNCQENINTHAPIKVQREQRCQCKSEESKVILLVTSRCWRGLHGCPWQSLS